MDPFDDIEERSPDERYDSAMEPLYTRVQQFSLDHPWLYWQVYCPVRDFFGNIWDVVVTFKWFICVVTVVVIAIFASSSREAETYHYREVHGWAEEHEWLLPYIEEALDNDHLSYNEHDKLEGMVDDYEEAKEIEEQKQALKNTLSQ